MMHGSILAFVSVTYPESEIYLIDLQRYLTVNVFNSPSASNTSPAWSINGQLAFTQEHSEIYVFDPTDNSLTDVTDNLGFNLYEPVWSPDGSFLAFRSADRLASGIFVLDVTNGTITGIADETSILSPSWSPDGRYIAYGVPYVITGLKLKVIDTTSGDFVFGIDNIVTGASSFYSWSPDESYIAFARNQNDNVDIYLFTISSSEVTNVTNHPSNDVSPLFSPDGQYLAFWSDRDDTSGDFYILQLATGIVTNISNIPNVFETNLSWSWDSRQIAFTADYRSDYEIYVYNLVTGNSSNMTNSPNNREYMPVWMP